MVVASNLFADILTDLGGAIQGSLGMPPSANIDPTRRKPSLFEPVHGSARTSPGRDRQPPGHHLGGADDAGLPGATPGRALDAGDGGGDAGGTHPDPRPGGSATTSEVAGAVCDQIGRLAK